MNRCLAPLIVLALLVVACTTPKIAMDQATNTVSLIQNLQTELTKYRANAQRSAERRLNSTKQADVGTLEAALNHQWGDYLYRESGLGSELAARTRLRDASDAYSKIISDQDKARDELAARLLTITKALPSPNEKLGAVQKAMAQLGTELSASERVAIVTTFLQQAKCVVDQSAKPSESAASSPASPASGASAPSSASSCTASSKKEKV